MQDTTQLAEAIIILGKAIGAGIAVLAGIGTGIGQGISAGTISEAIARNPEAEGKIMSKAYITYGIAESPAIYGFVVAMLILFALN